MVDPSGQAERKVFTLLQLSTSIKNTIEKTTGNRFFWIKAEISGLKIANSGHGFLDLVEHRNGQKVAVLQATIWQSKIQYLKQTLKEDYSTIMKDGAEIVCQVQVSFHAIYGLKVSIYDVDLTYNLGELEKRKLETIQKLKDLGLFDLNRLVIEPKVIQKIALVASPGTSAHEDFMNHLTKNEYGFKFHVNLFPVVVQGSAAVESLRAVFKGVNAVDYDVIVIIRGGGSKLDLDPFNDFDLASLIAKSSIPVLTGLGHETDVSVLDMIARSPHKTPTAAADFIVDKAAEYLGELQRFYLSIAQSAQRLLKDRQLFITSSKEILVKYPITYCQTRRGELSKLASQVTRLTTSNINSRMQVLESDKLGLLNLVHQRLGILEVRRLAEMEGSLKVLTENRMKVLVTDLKHLQESLEILNPENTLKRGFSISRLDGKAVKDLKQVKVGETLQTEITDGVIESKILKIKSK